jgi:hypothetical protein
MPPAIQIRNKDIVKIWCADVDAGVFDVANGPPANATGVRQSQAAMAPQKLERPKMLVCI